MQERCGFGAVRFQSFGNALRQGCSPQSGQDKQQGVAFQQIYSLGRCNGQAPQPQHPANTVPGTGKGGCVKEHKAEYHRRKQIHMAKNTVLFQKAQQHQLFQDQQGRKIEAPAKEIPSSSMPEARQQPDNKDIAQLLFHSLSIAPQGDIHIVPEPAAQGHMPPPPELRNAGGDIGIVEVFREPEAQKRAQTDGHITVAGKIEIDVQGVAQGIEPGKEHAAILGSPPCGADFPQKVGKQYFLSQAHQESGHALLKVSPPALFQLLRHIRIPDNRAGNELREHGHVAGKVNGIFLHLGLSPVHVHRIAENLEGVKADANRQRQLQ